MRETMFTNIQRIIKEICMKTFKFQKTFSNFVHD